MQKKTRRHLTTLRFTGQDTGYHKQFFFVKLTHIPCNYYCFLRDPFALGFFFTPSWCQKGDSGLVSPKKLFIDAP